MVLNVKVSEIKFVYFFYLNVKIQAMLVSTMPLIYEI